MVKVGDKVNITDGSWSYLLKDGVLFGGKKLGVIEKKVWKVVAVDCVLPTYLLLYIKRSTTSFTWRWWWWGHLDCFTIQIEYLYCS